MVEMRYYTKAEAAELLGVCTKTIGRYLLSGKLRGAHFGKEWKISAGDIHNFYEDGKAETALRLKLQGTTKPLSGNAATETPILDELRKHSANTSKKKKSLDDSLKDLYARIIQGINLLANDIYVNRKEYGKA
ncbi:MAG: helix-turn-helix domain-containing protein [Dehalococcoidia bacterium]|nr:helix-turn-helix domain-containing protein [Dehalococcoidia bacterium]